MRSRPPLVVRYILFMILFIVYCIIIAIDFIRGLFVRRVVIKDKNDLRDDRIRRILKW